MILETVLADAFAGVVDEYRAATFTNDDGELVEKCIGFGGKVGEIAEVLTEEVKGTLSAEVGHLSTDRRNGHRLLVVHV